VRALGVAARSGALGTRPKRFKRTGPTQRGGERDFEIAVELDVLEGSVIGASRNAREAWAIEDARMVSA
jgi:hypothetical protein